MILVIIMLLFFDLDNDNAIRSLILVVTMLPLSNFGYDKDSPGHGVGALIYQDGCFVGIGYNGFPRGNRCGQYLQNYPEPKEDCAQSQKKASGAQQQSTHFIICAEANALYFR
ncbi:hypothetical protein scyTo_0021100 [Scyliorhinus torazame]|uniref:CMP/dCMP-type deaminase domain-containing protein n=1 Tax=Scyliorhinus torazame TaxID=75743 RepID=A0A401PWH2_SCYTO|nr:hypothetical protein [Scyliorhinus torazame]